jgi:hypothetical protein
MRVVRWRVQGLVAAVVRGKPLVAATLHELADQKVGRAEQRRAMSSRSHTKGMW